MRLSGHRRERAEAFAHPCGFSDKSTPASAHSRQGLTAGSLKEEAGMLDWIFRSTWRTGIAIAVWVTLCFLASYGAAHLGHPTAVWLWGDMLGLL